MLEQLRKGLIKWNVAPLAIVAFLMFIMWRLTEYVLNQACDLDPLYASGLFGLIGGIGLYLQKIYGSMQKDRGLEHDTDDKE